MNTTNIHTACHNNDISFVEQFLKTAKPEAINRKLTDYLNSIQGTPLQIACKNGHLEIVKLLVEAGSDIEKKDISRQSPLSLAASENQFEIAHYLISQGADIFSNGPNQMQPIHFACAYADRKMIELLLSKGADIQILDGLKSSLLDYTTHLDGGNLEAAKTLIENGIDKKYLHSAFKWACWRNNPDLASYFLECGADYRSQTTPKSELLFWICSLGYDEIVKILLDLGVDFTIQVKLNGKMLRYDGSPLERAKEVNRTKIVELIERSLNYKKSVICQ